MRHDKHDTVDIDNNNIRDCAHFWYDHRYLIVVLSDDGTAQCATVCRYMATGY